MISKAGKISTTQMFSVLFLCRIISLFTFMLPSASYLPAGDHIIAALTVGLFELFYAFLVFVFLKYNKSGIIKAASDLSVNTGKVIAVIYCLAFIWFSGIGTARFELFLSTVMFPNSELHFMIILLLAAAFYASLKGTEAIGRASFILAAIMAVSIIFVLTAVAGEFEVTNLQPILTNGLMPVLGFSFYTSVRSIELITLLVTAPMINGSIKKMTLLWIFSLAVIITVILVFLTGVTGEYGADQIFPLYTLTVIANFGIFERLDDILTGIWVFCIFIQISFFTEICSVAVKQTFKKINKVTTALFCTVGIFLVYLLTSRTVSLFSEIVSSKVMEFLFILLIAVIPLLITISKAIIRREKL